MAIQFINSTYLSQSINSWSNPSSLPNSGYNQMLQRYYEVEQYMGRYYTDYDNQKYYNTQQNTQQSTLNYSSWHGDDSVDEDINFLNPQSTSISGKNNNKAYNIAVVDFCDDSQADIDLDGDGIADMAHGNVVANLLDSAYKNADIWTFDISGNTNEKIINSLQTIVDELKSGSCKYDAVNLSLSSRISYSTLSQALGVTITKDNVAQYKTQIKNWLQTQGKNQGYATTAQVVQLLDQIEALGADVFVAAANVNDGTDDELNLYTLADNVTSVGALSKSGSKASFSFDNSLIDTWALGEIEVKKVKDSSGKLLGYDLNNDGKVDISGTYSSGGTNASNAYLRGTSFATPYRMMQALSS